MGRLADAFGTFSELVREGSCRPEAIDDAKSKRLHIAYELAGRDTSYKRVLKEGLNDPNIDLRLSSAMWLAELDDKSGLSVFFEVLETETDQDRRDTAIKYILKLGSEEDKERLKKILEKPLPGGDKPKMLRLIIRDVSTNEETIKVNVPIGLFNVVIKSLSEEQLKLIEDEAGINLRNINIDLEDMPPGHILFKVIDPSGTEIKLFLE